MVRSIRKQVCDDGVSAVYLLKKMHNELRDELVNRYAFFEDPSNDAMWSFGPEAFNKLITDPSFNKYYIINESYDDRTIMGIKFVIINDIRKMPPNGIGLRFEKDLTEPRFVTRYEDFYKKIPYMKFAKVDLEKNIKLMNKIFGIGGVHMHSIKDNIKEVIFNDPATIIIWNDGTKTVVKAENEPYDPEKGLAMCIAKKALGNKGNYYDIFRKWLPKED